MPENVVALKKDYAMVIHVGEWSRLLLDEGSRISIQKYRGSHEYYGIGITEGAHDNFHYIDNEQIEKIQYLKRSSDLLPVEILLLEVIPNQLKWKITKKDKNPQRSSKNKPPAQNCKNSEAEV